jgi:hypothetical protein
MGPTHGVVLDFVEFDGPPVDLGWRLESGARTPMNGHGPAF